MKSFEELREEYERSSFGEHEASDDPIEQFTRWYHEALREDLPLANACALATATTGGVPSVRMVLLKGFDHSGFVFFTNYESRKGRDLAENPRASLMFWWTSLERQIRIDGICSKVASDESDAYFQQRPRASNLSAMISKQSQIVASREALDNELLAVEQAWAGRELERPPGWGGYRLVPDSLEFWQGRGDRLHDRLRYRMNPEGWLIERLYP